ncbi:bifunctional 2-polyprenyl-6-hydroxyphenol methylase/3-demethylubiquinol 3-O-methyltransferase UbiG [Spirosoma sp. KNUC1025]|uniref:class I SAM-dependent methyltransferase n=1 Tax=Spirosoma sp. KNUC1025 TaxID=2894082 RepID=UPI003864D461|nr:class I SAM-dependent methyltransferase [Spirosoma sp. KNUC1025]
MSSRNAIDFHNDIAARFDQKYESSPAFRDRFQVWTTLFDRYIRQTDQVMDMGCGSGIFSNYLAEKGCRVTGIDGSPAMIKLCNEKKTSPNVQYIRQSLPVDDLAVYQQQDAIVLSSVLEYIDPMAPLIQQVRTLLKPNGILFVSIPNSLSVYRRVERIIFQLTGQPAYVGHIRNRSTEAVLTQELSQWEFDVLETVYLSNHDPISRLLKPLLARQYVNNLFIMVCRKRNT